VSDGPATVLRTGLDLVAVADVADAIAVHGDRYLDRVFTAGERRDCTGPDGVPAVERLAARFAAKEAAIKVLRPDRDTPLPWSSIEVVRDPDGWAALRWHGRAAALAELRGVREIAVSLTHERETAACVVVARVLAPRPN
jgi:holo-[acyl-carrier protein] synthase